MSAVPKQFTSNQNKAKARYLVALKGVLDWNQIRQSVALFDDLCAAGIDDITPEHFGAVIASGVPGTADREAEIIAALNGDGPAEPVSGTAGALQGVPAVEVKLDAPTEVFTAVMNSILHQLDDHAGAKVDGILTRLPSQLASGGGVREHEHAFRHWVDTFQSQGQGQMIMDLPVSNIPTITDALYTIVCDSCGPQITDKVFDRAISATEKLPAARKYSPRQLL